MRAMDRIAAEIVRAWFCPHLHRHDRHDGFAVHCFCLHCRESWTVPFYAYKDHGNREEQA
jgi:hypothetical protein